MTTLSCDFETRSEAVLTGPQSVGLHNYMACTSTRALMLAWAWDDNPHGIEQVDFARGERLPSEVRDALTDPHVEKWAYNGQFERLATKHLLGLDTPIRGWRCSMALAYMRSFAGGLGDVGAQMGLEGTSAKDPNGGRLVRMFSQPQRVTKNQPHVWRDRLTDPGDWADFLSYNRRDVAAEIAVKQRLIRDPVLPEEWELYEIDQEMNDNGLPVDVRFVESAIRLTARRKAELMAMMRELTGLDNPNSSAQILPWLQARGYPFDDLQKATVAKVLSADTGHEVHDAACLSALRLRQQASRSSVRKYDAIARRVAQDGRLKYCFQFSGASRTGRWAGRGPQPQNLVRTPKQLEAESHGAWSRLRAATEAIREGDYDTLSLIVHEPMTALAGCLRSSFRAMEGHEFDVCDLAAIESAVIAWLSGCRGMLEVFDLKLDPYKSFAVHLYGSPYEKITKEQRTICKPPVLGCLAADTPVLTDRGWVRIVEVTSGDRVHDGAEFVDHSGVLSQGVKQVIDMFGVFVTPDHLMMTAPDEWRASWHCVQSTRIASRAISLACGLLGRASAANAANDITSAVAKVAAGREGYTATIWKQADRALARLARMRGHARNAVRSTFCSAGRATLSTVWRTATMLFSPVAEARDGRGRAMVGAASSAGSTAFTSSSATAFLCRGMTTQDCTSTAETTTGTTRRAISALSPVRQMEGTSRTFDGLSMKGGACARLSFGSFMRRLTGRTARLHARYGKVSRPNRSSTGKAGSAVLTEKETYDLLNCGPRSRFVILTDRGPMIAHNCGFGLGGGKLVNGKKTGLWGYAEALQVNITQEEAERQVEAFRKLYHEIPLFWRNLQQGIERAMRGDTATVGGLLRMERRGEFLTIRLPSGRKMYYHRPKVVLREFQGKDGKPYTRRVFTCMGMSQVTKKWGRVTVGSPKVCENIVQAVARDVLAVGKRRAHAAGFQIVGTVHDELITLRRKGDNRLTFDGLRRSMVDPIPWAKGLPLSAAGYTSDLYVKD